jgi:ubiquinone/menaquinone biosynthesis C-methylase UbiE
MLRWIFKPRSTKMSSMSTDEHRDHHGNPKDLQEYIAKLDDPERDEWQRPDTTLAALGITQDSVVCEIGTGTGYFALRLAKLAAWIYAVDVEPQLLSLLSDRAAIAGVQNLTPVLGQPLDPRIPPATCDLILMVNTFHHIPDKASSLRRLQASLRLGGLIAIIDFHKRELPVGPPEDHKLAREECLAQIQVAGLRVRSEYDTLPYQYFLVVGT